MALVAWEIGPNGPVLGVRHADHRARVGRCRPWRLSRTAAAPRAIVAIPSKAIPRSEPVSASWLTWSAASAGGADGAGVAVFLTTGDVWLVVGLGVNVLSRAAVRVMVIRPGISPG